MSTDTKHNDYVTRAGILKLLSDEEMVEEVRRMDGTPEELIEHPEAREMILRLLRADLAVVETYSYVDALPLRCPITAFGGVDDGDVSEQELEQWSMHTTERFRLQMFAGHHFYLYGARDRLLNSIRKDLGLIAPSTIAEPKKLFAGSSL